MPVCVIKGLVAEHAAREQMPFVHKSIMDVLCSFGRSVIRQSHLTETVVEDFNYKTEYHIFNFGYYVTEYIPFSEEKIV